tara:strand:+ start:6911 stop:7600 length:690 start_codon:yes stop_codon:yes gene_type:complete
MDTLNTVGTKLNTLLENNTVKSVVLLILALYSVFAAPALPNSVIRFFDTIVGKLLFLFLIAFVASQDVQVAILLSVAFLITLQVANKQFTEKFSMMDDIENAYLASKKKAAALLSPKQVPTTEDAASAGDAHASTAPPTPPQPTEASFPAADSESELTACRKNLLAKEQQLAVAQKEILRQQDEEVNSDDSSDDEGQCAGDAEDASCSEKNTVEGFSVSSGQYALANFI